MNIGFINSTTYILENYFAIVWLNLNVAAELEISGEINNG